MCNKSQGFYQGQHSTIRFSDGTWTHVDTEGEIYGQHIMMCGACDFVRWYLITKDWLTYWEVRNE